MDVRTRRIVSAVLLTVLAPIEAEFLLGDFTIKSLGLVLVLLPLYGCGALLIREVARRTNRGWPSILLLGAAYSLLEEGFLTQSLFNRNYIGQRLLDYGYVPALGTSLNWSVFVLSIHVVWSIATPILIAEGIAADQRQLSWLKTSGLVITSLLFLVGCTLTASFSLKSSAFLATRSQFIVVGLLVLLAVVGSFTIRSRGHAGAHETTTVGSIAPQPIWPLLVTLALASVFMVVEPVARDRGMAPFLSVLTRLACEIGAAGLIVSWSRTRTWGPHHYLAISAGTTLTYSLYGFVVLLHGHTNLGVPTGRIDVAGQIVLTSVVFLLIWWGARRSRVVLQA